MSRNALFVAAALCLTSPALADPVNLLVNGGFETTTNGPGELVPGHTGAGYTQATGWNADATSANAGYPFLFIAAPGTPTTTGFPDPWDNGNRYLWGAANGGASAWDGTSVDGGNFLVADGDYHRTPIYQNVSGLIVGHTYAVNFDWAAAQWAGNTGATTETFQVGLGGQTAKTATFNLASKGFSGWMHQTFDFTYDGTSDALSFLALGTPAGEPPMMLLDGVSLTDVPEPAEWTLLLAGLAGLTLALRRRNANGQRG